MFAELTDELLDLRAAALRDGGALYAMIQWGCCSCCCCLGQGSGEA